MKIRRLVTTTMLTLSFATITTVGIDSVQGENQIKVQAATTTYSDEQLNGMSDSELATALGYTSITRITYDASNPDKEYPIVGTEYAFTIVNDGLYLSCVIGDNILGQIGEPLKSESRALQVTNDNMQTLFNSLIIADIGGGYPVNSTLPLGPLSNESGGVNLPTVPSEDDYLEPDVVTDPVTDILVDNTDPNAQPITTVDPSTSVESTRDSSSDASSQDTSVVLSDLTEKASKETTESLTSDESVKTTDSKNDDGTFEQTGLSMGLKAALLGIPIAIGSFFWLTKKDPEEINEVATIEVEPESDESLVTVIKSDVLVEETDSNNNKEVKDTN